MQQKHPRSKKNTTTKNSKIAPPYNDPFNGVITSEVVEVNGKGINVVRVEGAVVGCNVGCKDGKWDGLLLGLLGRFDGCDEGCLVGRFDGCLEGFFVGQRVGEGTGCVVGTWAGCSEGIEDG